MNNIKIKYILLFSCIILNIIVPDTNKQGFMINFFIPLEVEISLNFLKTEIENYKDELENNWDSSISQQIVKRAEHIAQSTPKDFQDNVTQKIIELFNNINIQIRFNDLNLTIIRENPKNKNSFDDLDSSIYLMEQKEEQLERIKKEKELNLFLSKKNKKTADPTKFKPKKIKGARKSMKKLQKYREDQRKKELARRKELLEFFRSHHQQAHNNKKQESIEKEEKNHDVKINQKVIENPPVKKPTNTLSALRKNVPPFNKQQVSKNIHTSQEHLPYQDQSPHELFATPSNLN